MLPGYHLHRNPEHVRGIPNPILDAVPVLEAEENETFTDKSSNITLSKREGKDGKFTSIERV